MVFLKHLAFTSRKLDSLVIGDRPERDLKYETQIRGIGCLPAVRLSRLHRFCTYGSTVSRTLRAYLYCEPK